MVYGVDPFSAQNATNTSAASIFGALPYPGSASVVGPHNGIHYRIVTDTSAQGITLVKDATGRNIALVEWWGPPTIHAQAIGEKLHVGQWLRLSSDRLLRTMTHCGVHYAWVPRDRFLQLFAPGSSEWLARVTRHHDTFVLELSSRAVELGLVDVAVLATVLMQSGKSID